MVQPGTLSTCSHVNGVVFADQKRVRYILGQFTIHPPYTHNFSATGPSAWRLVSLIDVDGPPALAFCGCFPDFHQSLLALVITRAIFHDINHSTCLISVPTYRDIPIVYPRSGQAGTGDILIYLCQSSSLIYLTTIAVI
jgi:hypothetical protein